MAYGQQSNSNRGGYSSNRTNSSNSSSDVVSKAKYILRTGMFEPKPGKDGKVAKALASIQLKESVTLPAGSYVSLYEAERKNEKSPIFTLAVKEGKLNTKPVGSK